MVPLLLALGAGWLFMKDRHGESEAAPPGPAVASPDRYLLLPWKLNGGVSLLTAVQGGPYAKDHPFPYTLGKLLTVAEAQSLYAVAGTSEDYSGNNLELRMECDRLYMQGSPDTSRPWIWKEGIVILRVNNVPAGSGGYFAMAYEQPGHYVATSVPAT